MYVGSKIQAQTMAIATLAVNVGEKIIARYTELPFIFLLSWAARYKEMAILTITVKKAIRRVFLTTNQNTASLNMS